MNINDPKTKIHWMLKQWGTVSLRLISLEAMFRIFVYTGFYKHIQERIECTLCYFLSVICYVTYNSLSPLIIIFRATLYSIVLISIRCASVWIDVQTF